MFASQTGAPLRCPERFFVGGQWVAPSTAPTITVIDSATEQSYFRPDEAQAEDVAHAAAAARDAFEERPWPRLSRAERAVASQLRSGTVGHNAFRTDFGIAFGGFKQSGIGRKADARDCSPSSKPRP